MIPLVDILAVGALRLVPENGGVGVLVVLPAVWLGVDHRERGVLLTALAVILTVSVPQLVYFGLGADSWSRAVLLPVISANVAMAGAALARMWTRQSHRLAIKHEELEKTYEHEQQVAAQQELIAQTIDVGLVMIDRNGAYTSLNSKQRELLEVGYPEGHRGRAGQEGMVFAEDRVTPLGTDDMPTTRALRGERYTDYVIWVGDPEVRQLAISVSAAPMFDALGAFDGAVLVYKDVTDLVNALRVKDDFVATVSHELRTPLTSIMGFLDLVTETDESLTETTRAQLSIVKRNSERLLRLVSDLLLAAQTDEGRLTLSTRRQDLSALVEQAVGDVAPQARDGSVRLERADRPRHRAGDGRDADAPDGRQPGQQRGEVHPARRARRGRAHRGRTTGCCSAWSTPASASPPTTRSTCSPASSGLRRPRPSPSRERGSAWRSPRRSSRRTAAPSPWPPSWDAARSSRCCCPASWARPRRPRPTQPPRPPDPGPRGGQVEPVG